MHKNRLMVSLVILLIISSSFSLALAQGNETDTCTGFSWFKCLLFGDASKRPVVGSAWYDRGVSLPWYEPEGRALVGEIKCPL